MTFRAVLVHLLCACLLLPAHVGMARVDDTAKETAAASTLPPDCHGSASSHRDRVALPDPGDQDRPGGGDPIPQSCCHQCDCGCPPTIALTAARRAAPALVPTTFPGDRVATWPASGSDTPLRPPIA